MSGVKKVLKDFLLLFRVRDGEETEPKQRSSRKRRWVTSQRNSAKEIKRKANPGGRAKQINVPEQDQCPLETNRERRGQETKTDHIHLSEKLVRLQPDLSHWFHCMKNHSLILSCTCSSESWERHKRLTILSVCQIVVIMIDLCPHPLILKGCPSLSSSLPVFTVL